MRTRIGILIISIFALFLVALWQFGRISTQPTLTSPTHVATSTPKSMAVPSPTPPPTTLSAPLANTPFLTRDQAIYVITDKGLLRRIPDTETLRALGYEPEQIITYPDELLAPYALASDLTHWLDSADEYTLLYYLDQGTRRDVPDLEMALAMNADLLDIIPADSSLASDLPHFDQPLPHATRTPDQISHPRTTAIAWAHGQLWTANESGRLTTWGEGDWQLANPFPARKHSH